VSSKESKEPSEPTPDITAVTEPSPGGSLAEYVDHLVSLDLPARLSANGDQAWVPGERGHLQRLPVECTEVPDPAEVRRLLRLRGIWLVSYQLPADEAHPANCFNYVRRDPDYRIEDLPSKVRNKVRRGLRNFTVRLCTWDEVVEKGFQAFADTDARHGNLKATPAALHRYAEARRHLPFYDIWGAWFEEELAGWTTIVKIDDWAMIEVGRSRTHRLRLAPNNAIRYVMTRHLLQTERRAFVSSGVSSLQEDGHQLSMHTYKTGMGYEAIPLCRTFVPRTLLSPALTTRPGSWTVEKIAGVFPKLRMLRKAAGLSRLLSGRETEPLRWSDSASQHEAR